MASRHPLPPSGAPAGTAGTEDRSEGRFQAVLGRVIQLIDRRVGHQLDRILHDPRFQRLEASWRGLRYLTETEAACEEREEIRIKVLNVGWAELARDLARALEFDQSHIFARIYSDELDTPGGEPFGVLLGDYAVSHRPRGNELADVEMLDELGRVAMAALCPFVTDADSALFGLDSYRELPPGQNFEPVFQQREYGRWNALRRGEHARFLGLTLPRTLMRAPYRDDGTRQEPLRYREGVAGHPEHYLWGHACYAFGGVVIRAFANTGWFADIRGGEHLFGEGGVVRGLVYSRFEHDPVPAAARSAAELQIDDHMERAFSNSGCIPLCSRHGTERTAFFSNSSLHDPGELGSEAANMNARLSAMIQYMLCVSRFGHCIKLMGRDRVGSFANADECQRMLQDWLNRYTTSADGTSSELKARYPLADSRVEVAEIPGRPGYFNCIVYLQPHFQLDQLAAGIRLVTELAVGPTGAWERADR